MRVDLRGCERSGTRLAEHWLFGQHFPEVDLDLRHKHHLTEKHNSRVVLITKHPYPWLISFWRMVRREDNPYVPAWIGRPVCGCPLGRLVGGGAYWSSFHRHWMESTRSVYVVLYEELLLDPKGEIERLGEWLFMRPGEIQPMPEERYVPFSEDLRRFDPAYYLDAEWRVEFTQEVWEWLHREVDWELAERIGYGPPEVVDAHLC
jgi:hypothetical protein